MTSTRHRSPAYPAFSLKTAVAKLGQVYEAHRRAPAEADMLKRAMGYELTTSHSMRAISALVQFGLIEEDGGGTERRLRISELGLGIVLRKEMDSERVALLRKAAMRPVIYRQMLDMWKEELPSDDVISKYLLFSRNFNPAVVSAVIRDFRATHQFARLSWVGAWAADSAAAVTIASGPPASYGVAGPADTSVCAANVSAEMGAAEPSYRRYQLPLPHGRIAAVEVPADAGQADLDFVVRYLLLMKEAM